jgi:DNA-binding NtrC family response regulator
MFEQAGYEVTAARNGAEGVKMFHEKPADLLIADLLMPEKDGFETFLELKKCYPNIKCFAISGGGRLGPESYLKLAKKIGVLRTFEKPFDCRDMLDAVALTLKDNIRELNLNS